MLFLFQTPEIFDAETWPWPAWIVFTFAALWLIKQAAEAINSFNTIKRGGEGVWAWVKRLFTSSRVQAAKERQEMKESIESLTNRFTAVESRTEQIATQSTEIMREVKPNGGESLNDQVSLMGRKMDNVSDKVESMSAWIQHEKETSEKPIFFLDSSGNMTFVNYAFRELLDAEESELLELKYLNRLESRDQKRLKAEIEFAIANQINLDTVVYAKRQGPHFIAIRLRAQPDVSANGSLKAFFGSASVTDDPEKLHLSQA